MVLQITVDGDCSYEIKTLDPWKKSYHQPRQHIEKQRHYFANKVCVVKAIVVVVVVVFQWACMDVSVEP